jgi:hypothetical protein
MGSQRKSDRRETPRVNIGNLVGFVDLRDGSERQVICVWDISRGGACLMVDPQARLSDDFDLVIDDLAMPVQKVWQHGIHIGVKFCLGQQKKDA